MKAMTGRRLPILIAGLMVLTPSCSYEQARELELLTGMEPFEEVEIVGAIDNPWGREFHPFVGAAVIDIDGDGHQEIFVGGGDGQPDSLFTMRDGKLVNIIESTSLSELTATHGANSIDLDNDGDTDLLVTRADGLFLYVNDNGRFTKRQIPVDLPADAAPLNVAVGDFDRDNDGDLYISNFIDFANFRSVTFSDPSHAKTNILLRNDGELSFTDITAESGTASLQNTFLSSFIDVNQDGWLDLVVAQNTGQVEFFRNNRNGTFSPQTVKTGWGFWMGLTAGDIDKDGDQDLFFTNSGTSVPHWFLEIAGDGTDAQPRNYGWILLRNDGDFKFTDVTQAYQLDNYGFGWGAAFEDLTLNGELDLLVAQNYIKWPPHRWFSLSSKSFALQDGKYYHLPALGLENPAFAQAPLIADLNNDGRPDVFWVNMEGAPRAFLNRSYENFITLEFPDNSASIGVSAYLVVDGVRSYTRLVQNNSGFSTDGAATLTFGLGRRRNVEKIEIRWSDGRQRVIEKPRINQVIQVTR